MEPETDLAYLALPPERDFLFITDFQICAGVAGIFSSEVGKAAGNETLIRSPDCGYLNFNETGTSLALAALNSVEVNDTLTATTYSRACYGNSQNSLQCTQYPQPQLLWKVNQNATCPFSDDLCFYGDSSAYEMDTGLIDSHQALGINAPKSERVQYRKVTTCKLYFLSFKLNIYNSDLGAYGQQQTGSNEPPLDIVYLREEMLIQRTIRLTHPHPRLCNNSQ